MRKFRSVLIALLFCLTLGLSSAFATRAHADDVVNVKDYGAIGDGKADDTAAIQKAANAARDSTIAFNPGTVYTGSSPWLYFPSGCYNISDEIKLGAYANVGSTAKAIIRQTDKKKDILKFDGAYQVTVRSLRFVGGKHQIYYSNPNLDISTINIDDCEFAGSSDYAIYTWGTASKEDSHLSCVLSISRSRFVNPNKVLYNQCDNATVRDCWVQISASNFDENSAAFHTRGNLFFDNMFGVPSFGANMNSRVRWIDHLGGNLILDRSRFGGEDAGIPLIYCYAPPEKKFPFMGSTITITNSALCSGATVRPDSGVLRLMTGMPSVLWIKGNSFLIHAPYVRVDPSFDLKKFLTDYPQPNRFKMEIGPNMTWAVPEKMPEELTPFLTWRDAE